MLNGIANSKRPGPPIRHDTLAGTSGSNMGHQQALVLNSMRMPLDFCSWHEYGEYTCTNVIHAVASPRIPLEGQGCEQSLYEKHGTDQIAQVRQCANGFIFLTDEEQVETSSSVIRRCISEGRQPRYLLPGNVWKYIREHDLYRDAQA